MKRALALSLLSFIATGSTLAQSITAEQQSVINDIAKARAFGAICADTIDIDSGTEHNMASAVGVHFIYELFRIEVDALMIKFWTEYMKKPTNKELYCKSALDYYGPTGSKYPGLLRIK